MEEILHMKKILLLLLCISFYSFAIETTTGDVANALSRMATSTTKMFSDDRQQIVADNKAQDFIEELDKNSVKVEEYEVQSAKNEFLDRGGLKRSLYKEYMANAMSRHASGNLFGVDIINNAVDKYVPTSISKDYILSKGDVISVKIWNDLYTEQKTSQVYAIDISKTGTIFIPELGTFQGNNKSIASLENEILLEGRKKLKHFNTELNLERVREISIFVLGEVNRPDQILTTPFNNILNVLNKANGVKNKASLRNIKIIRGKDEIKIDLYAYFLGNKNIDELKLQDGDTLLVPVSNNLLSIEGSVNRPAIYEMNYENSYEELINLAGGFSKTANQSLLQGYFINDNKITIKSLKVDSQLSENLIKITINNIDENNRNNVFIAGAVVNPGTYSFEERMHFSDLLEKSGGFRKESTESFGTIIRGRENKKLINFDIQKENPILELDDEVYIYNYKDINNIPYINIQGAVINPGSYELYEGSRLMNLLYAARGLNEALNPYMQRADLYRIDREGKLKVFKIDLNKLLAGDEIENMLLHRDDIVRIYSYDEVVEHDDIYIYGEVRSPGKFRYYENMTIEDLLFYAKGLKNKSDKNIVISRNDEEKGAILEFNINIDRNPDFKLLEGDLIFVRKRADWIDVELVKIDGFVTYPGTYQINRGETLSDLIVRAGGFLEEAFPAGITFNRGEEKKKITNFEYNPQNGFFTRDIELQDGDTINVPQITTTVRVEGEVFAPSHIIYDASMKNYKDYIKAAGGYKSSAYKRKVFIIKANGKTIDKPRGVTIEPGDTIFVPEDIRKKKGYEKFIDLFKGTLEIVGSVALILVLL